MTTVDERRKMKDDGWIMNGRDEWTNDWNQTKQRHDFSTRMMMKDDDDDDDDKNDDDDSHDPRNRLRSLQSRAQRGKRAHETNGHMMGNQTYRLSWHTSKSIQIHRREGEVRSGSRAY